MWNEKNIHLVNGVIYLLLGVIYVLNGGCSVIRSVFIEIFKMVIYTY